MSTATATFVDIARGSRWRAFDWQLLLYLVLLVGFGIVMGYSANYQSIGGTGLSQTVKTLIWTGIGLTLFFVAASVDHHWLQTFATPIYLLVVGLLTGSLMFVTFVFGELM
jgi:cell division protein FtsW (lipid II flippase)